MKKDTKKLLLEKGLEIFSLKGFNHTGIQEVLAEVSVPKGSFYYYFKSKKDFGFQVIDHYTQQSLEIQRQFLEDARLSPLDRLKAFFRENCKLLVEQKFCGGCIMGNLSQEMGDLCPDFRVVLEEKWRQFRDGFSRCIRQAMEAGEINTQLAPDDLADFMLNSWHGAMMRMKVSKTDAPLQLFLKTVFGPLVGNPSLGASA